MTNNRNSVSFEPFFGGFVLETLTIGMYGEARNAIREYIQNGFDSIQRAIEDLKILPSDGGLIKIELAKDRDSLTIHDNGAGLSAKNAATILTRVGASNKSHSKNAGFRGIGRLAGIVFSDTVTFITKAKGEGELTTVIIDAKAMRDSMAPGKGSTKSAEELMRDGVRAFRTPTQNVDGHFFEVKLEGFTDAPDECLSLQEMTNFVSQVAPVPYPEDFPFSHKLLQVAKSSGIPIEDVRITVQVGSDEPKPVTKRYHESYKFESGSITLSDCAIHQSNTGDWWAWIGKKAESGAYTDSRVSGLRVRVRNIQIDGTEIVRDIFREHAQSHVRFQDYYLGEVFIKPGALVPNARRDGFEEDAAWKRIRNEIAIVVKRLGKEAYQVSAQGQISVEALRKGLKNVLKDLIRVQNAKFSNTDDVIALSKKVTTMQSRISKAMLGADMETAAEFQHITSALADIKHEALMHIGSNVAAVDRENVQKEAREELLQEILLLLEDSLSPDCFVNVRATLAEEYGYP